MISAPGAPFSLPAAALEWLSAVLSCPAGRLHLHRLNGATSSTLYKVTVTGSEDRFVLRCLTNTAWLAEEPDLIERERAALTALARIDFSAPRWVADDAAGQHCGVPALLMTALPGRVWLTPRNIDGWLRELAKPLMTLHNAPVEGIRWQYAPYVNPQDAHPPDWSTHPALWERGIELARRPWPNAPMRFIHRDYHPVNVLFSGSRLSGVVDWPNACLGPADFDIAWCRLNLACMVGTHAAQEFLQACRELSGSQFSFNPYWDLLALVELLPGPPQPYPPWQQFGLPPLTSAEMIRRDELYLESVLHTIEA